MSDADTAEKCAHGFYGYEQCEECGRADGLEEAARIVDADADITQKKADELNTKGITEFGALRHHEAHSLRGMARFLRDRATLVRTLSLGKGEK